MSGQKPAGFLARFKALFSIRNRLILYFLIVVLIPTFIISVATYTISENIIAAHSQKSIQSSFNAIKSNILTQLASIDYIATSIYTNQELLAILSREKQTDRATITTEIATLDRVLKSYHIPDEIQEGVTPKIYMYNRPEYKQYSFSESVFDLSELESEEWYRALPVKAKYSVVGYDKALGSIKLVKKLYALKNMEVPFGGVLMLDIPIKRFTDILEELRLTPATQVSILNADGVVQLSTDQSLLAVTLPKDYPNQSAADAEIGRHKEPSLVSHDTISQLNWEMLACIPVRDLNNSLTQFKSVLVAVILACVVLGLMCALTISDHISRPIRKMVKSMSTIRDGNFQIDLEYKKEDEFKYLIDTYKNTIAEIDRLIHELYISEANTKNAELKALQAQINPHFLYNTLDSVNWMAIKNDVPEISDMVTSLSDFFRYSLSKGKSIITIEDELKQLKSYIYIQKVRFRQKLDYEINVPEELGQYLTVKLILQPIVENAIVHGVEQLRDSDHGVITISAERAGGEICFYISDNGIGADVDLLNRILSDSNQQSAAYGIKNVNDRIKYYAGSQYGLSYLPASHGGVTAVIRIPATKTDFDKSKGSGERKC